VTVKRIAAPAGRLDLPAGRGSSFLHDHVQVGDVLDVRAPAGAFFIDPLATEPLVLIGAGIGITPLASMLEAMVHAGRRRQIFVLWGFRSSGDHPFKTRLEKLAAVHSEIHVDVCYSAPQSEDMPGTDYKHPGRITFEHIRGVLPSNNLQFYVCGPGGFMESLVPALWDWGVPESHVHFEAFGPASVKKTSPSSRIVSEPCEVRFERTNRIAKWDGSFASLLEFGESAGVTLPSGCRAGSCGECLTAIRSGSVATMKRPGIPVPADHCLTCISVPEGDLVLEA
jgi:ferredoxin-NADP reductase